MRQQKRRVLGSAALGLGAALAIAGCGAGQITQTDSQESGANGAFGQAGAILVRDAALNFPDGPGKAYPVGADAKLTLRLVNSGPANDELVEVGSEGAASATIEGDRQIIAGSVLVIGSPEEHEVPGAAESATSEPSSSATTEPPAGDDPRVGEAEVTLKALDRELRPGQTVKVTFTFRNAGPITLDMPIAAPGQPRGEVHIQEAGQAQGGR